jgi:hypothetical protein
MSILSNIKKKVNDWFVKEIHIDFEEFHMTTNNYTLLLIYLISCLVCVFIFSLLFGL